MTPDMERLARAEPLHKSVQDAIRRYILDHDLKPGDPMASEVELARRLGVSRNSVREAVKSLQSLGVLESRHGSGLFVRAFSWDPLLDNLSYDLMKDVRALAELLDIRRILELGMVGQAVRLLTDEQRRELHVLLDRMQARAGLGEGFPEEDREFHRVLFRELGNGTFLRLLDIFWLAFRKAAESEADLVDVDPRGTYEGHRRIVEAAETGDERQAYAALEDHYRAIRERFRHQLSDLDNEEASLTDRDAPASTNPEARRSDR